MPLLIDTNVAIHLRDLEPSVAERIDAIGSEILLSIISLIELLGGLDRDRAGSANRRLLLNAMLETLEVLDFTPKEAKVYEHIVANIGFNRRKSFDRMIASQAIAANVTLVTMNPADFANIPGLSLEIWPVPAN